MRARLLTKTSVAGAGVILLCVVSVLALRGPFHDFVWKSSFENYTEVLPVTVWAALKLWTFWGFATAVSGLILIRIEPRLGLCDAILGGAATIWIFAYVAGNLLGPIGLFRSWTIWLLAIAVVLWLWRNPSRLEFRAVSTGQKLALLACALMAFSTLPVELGSPVPPYMDALNVPASVQRIMTFGKYLPFDNDPYGYWGPANQTPGVDLLYAFLGLGAHIQLGVLAVSAAMVPMAALILLATYRLGSALMGDVAGGMAALLVFASTLMLRAQIMRGTPVTFALLAIGLAFFVDRDRLPIRIAIGSLALGTALPSQAIDGGFALATAGSILLIRLLDDDLRNALREAACLVGAFMVGWPEFPVALQIKLPYPVLPIVQLAGIAVIWLAARSLPPRPNRRPVLTDWVMRLLILSGLVFLAWRADGIPRGMHDNFEPLWMLCMAGMAIAILSRRGRNHGIYVAALALLLGGLAQYLIGKHVLAASGSQAQFGLDDVLYKLNEYWAPYFLVFPAAVLFDWIYQNISKPLAVAALLALLIFPWSQDPSVDLSYFEHPLAVEWARNLDVAKHGWWGSSGDHRWAQSPRELRLSQVLRNEIRAGYITTATHIVHVTPTATIWKDVLLHSVFTGINDDIYVIHPDSDLNAQSSAGSRTRPIDQLPAALAKNPPYIVVFQDPPPTLSLPPDGYHEIFRDDETIRLFRRDSLTPH